MKIKAVKISSPLMRRSGVTSLCERLFCKSIRLSEIPRSMRMKNMCFYILALYADKNEFESYRRDLGILQADMMLRPVEEWLGYLVELSEKRSLFEKTRLMKIA